MDIKLINQYETHEQYIEAVKHVFAFAGFASCPLTDMQMCFLYRCGFDVDAAFSVGSDVYAGYGFVEAMEAL